MQFFTRYICARIGLISLTRECTVSRQNWSFGTLRVWSGSGNAQTVTDVGKHEEGDFIEWTITIRALISRGCRGEGDRRGLYHDNLIYLGSHRPLHAGPPLNSADHRGGKHHLLSVLKAATLSRSTPCSLPPEKITLYRSHEYFCATMKGGDAVSILLCVVNGYI